MKIFTLLSLLISLPFQLSIVRYNYSYYGDVIHSAPGMNFSSYFNEQMLGVEMQSPEDIVEYDGYLYIISSGSNNLLVINDTFQVAVRERNVEVTVDGTTQFQRAEARLNFKEFKLSEAYVDYLIANNQEVPSKITLNKPSGLDVKNTGIYIADTGNNRIVKLNHDFEVIAIYTEVDNITFETLPFQPVKVTTDTTGRMYVVAKGVYEGIIELDNDGSFNRFTGVNPIKLTPVEIFQRALMTEEQVAKLPKYLSTEYTNVTMTANNFIYATASASENNSDNMIQLINPKGVDVLKRNGYQVPKGDIIFIENSNNYVVSGPSQLSDIAIYKDGIYTVLDQKRSRLFTYDSEGNLLYINGDAGSQSDKFTEGVAITYFGDNLLILDRSLRTVVVYEHTEFGKNVNQAISHFEKGEFEEAAKVWEKVLVLNTNYEVAYSGIGKYYLRINDYENAIKYFELGHNIYYYSKAFKAHRNQIIKDNFGYIMGGIILIPAAIITIKTIKKRKENKIS